MKTSTSFLLICCCLSLFLGLILISETEANQHDLCACSLPTRSEAGKGCIVKKGECNADACPYPRLFMCDMTTIQSSDNTVTCGVMESGWEVCAESPESTRDGFQVMKPRPVV